MSLPNIDTKVQLFNLKLAHTMSTMATLRTRKSARISKSPIPGSPTHCSVAPWDARTHSAWRSATPYQVQPDCWRPTSWYSNWLRGTSTTANFEYFINDTYSLVSGVQIWVLMLKQETAKDGMAALQSGNKIWEDWLRTSLNAMVNLRYCMTLKFEWTKSRSQKQQQNLRRFT